MDRKVKIILIVSLLVIFLGICIFAFSKNKKDNVKEENILENIENENIIEKLKWFLEE